MPPSDGRAMASSWPSGRRTNHGLQLTAGANGRSAAQVGRGRSRWCRPGTNPPGDSFRVFATALAVCAGGPHRDRRLRDWAREDPPPSFRNGRISACCRSCGAVSISCRSRQRHPHGTSWRRRARRARHAGVLRASPATGSVLDVDAAADERSGEPTDSSLLDSEHLLRCVRERGRRTGQRAVTAASSSASRPVVSSPSMCAMSQRRWMTASATTASTVPSPKRW